MGTALEAVDVLLSLTSTIGNLMLQVNAVSTIISQMQAEGRTELTPAEQLTLSNADDVSRKALVDAIAKALAK